MLAAPRVIRCLLRFYGGVCIIRSLIRAARSLSQSFLSVEQNVKQPVRRCTFSEPTSAVAEGLGDHVGLVAARVQPQLALVVVGLPVATAHRHGRHVRRARGRADAVRAADLRALAAGVAFQLVAGRRYGRYRVRCGCKTD